MTQNNYKTVIFQEEFKGDFDSFDYDVGSKFTHSGNMFFTQKDCS